jgi:putative salt-induced outer membrane protein
MRFVTGLLSVQLLSMACLAEAEATGAADKLWSGEVSLAYILSNGNSENETLGTKSKVIRNGDKWRGTGRFDAVNSSSEEERTAEKYFVSGQLDNKLDDVSYLFTLLEHEDDRFSGFHYQTSLTVGYGRTFIDDGIHKLSAEVGPGYRRSEVEAGDSLDEEAVIRAAVDYGWQVSESAEFTEEFSSVIGDERSVSKSLTKLKVKINASLAMSLGYDLKYTSDVPPDTAKTDSTTLVGLDYSF